MPKTYFAKKNDQGNYEVFSTGQGDPGTRVATGTSDVLKTYGLSESQLATPGEYMSRIQARGGALPGADTSKAGQPGYDVFGNKIETAPPTGTSPDAGTLSDMERKLTEGIGKTAGETPDYATILKQKTEQANAIIDTLRSQFNEVIGQETQAGAERAARTRASNISAGLAGSDFGAAAAESDAEKTRKIIEAKQAERDAKINEVLTGVPSQADEAYRSAAELYRTNAEAGLTAIKTFRDNQRARVEKTIAAIAASGASFDSLQKSPEYQKVLDAYDGNESALKGAFISAIPQQEKVGSTTVGSKYVVFYRDPVSGTPNMVTYDLPANLGPEETVQNVFSNGQVAIKTTTYDSKGGKHESIRIENPGGFKATSDGGAYSPEDKRTITQAGLQNADQRVRDIFVNTPAGFRQHYIQQGKGTDKTTPDQVLTDLEAWEAQQGGGSNPFQ